VFECIADVDCAGICGGNTPDGDCVEYTDYICEGSTCSTVCHPDNNECEGETWSLSEYSGDILFIDMSASWCSPCYSSIDFIDGLEEYWSGQNSNVKFITALADIGEPYSCQQWGLQGSPNNIIVEDDGSLFNWFHDSNAQYPNYVIIDHQMTVRAKPSGLLLNSNTESCDGSDYMDSLDSDCLNYPYNHYHHSSLYYYLIVNQMAWLLLSSDDQLLHNWGTGHLNHETS
jgi:hypothetical protein